MNYTDKVYGLTTITEPVLLDVMHSTAMQRLKFVLQHGISGLLGITTPITRFDHSMGAMLLVRRLGGTVTEQIAAMLHDVSHTAFSHVIDYVFDGHDSQSYHDEKKEEYLAQTDVPAILSQHGYDWRTFVPEENFSLLEQSSPRLCADRLDYFLRDSLDLNLATLADIQFVLDHLVVVNGRIATDNLQAAQWLAYTYIEADDTSWANFYEVGIYELMAQALKIGLETSAINEADLWQTDKQLWDTLHAADHPALQAALKLVSPETQIVWDEAAPTFCISTKIRTIDPDVVVAGELRPLSTLDTDFGQHRTNYLARKEGKWPMRVIPAPS